MTFRPVRRTLTRSPNLIHSRLTAYSVTFVATFPTYRSPCVFVSMLAKQNPQRHSQHRRPRKSGAILRIFSGSARETSHNGSSLSIGRTSSTR